MGKKAKAPTPQKPDIGQDISQYVAGYGQALPGLLSFEQQYRPQFAALNIAINNSRKFESTFSFKDGYDEIFIKNEEIFRPTCKHGQDGIL